MHSQSWLLNAVVECPVDTELPMLLDKPQDGSEALGHAETVLPTALLPGKDGQELQRVGRGQRGTCVLNCNLEHKGNQGSVAVALTSHAEHGRSTGQERKAQSRPQRKQDLGDDSWVFYRWVN